MKKRVLLLAVVVFVLASCAAVPTQEISVEESMASEQVDADLQQSGDDNSQATVPGESALHLNDLEFSEEEISGIIFMRQEEKLARDVYLQLAELWGMNIFSNIASSEDTHMAAVLSLIEMAGQEDPVQDMANGEFLDQELQTLYDSLIARGAESLAESLLVGAAIEEIDILDLQEYLAQTENTSVAEVYQNLLNGSINHLNSFVRTYERQTGEEYEPQFLSDEAFQELLTASTQGGGGGRSGQPRGGRSQAQ